MKLAADYGCHSPRVLLSCHVGQNVLLLFRQADTAHQYYARLNGERRADDEWNRLMLPPSPKVRSELQFLEFSSRFTIFQSIPIYYMYIVAIFTSPWQISNASSSTLGSMTRQWERRHRGFDVFKYSRRRLDFKLAAWMNELCANAGASLTLVTVSDWWSST